MQHLELLLVLTSFLYLVLRPRISKYLPENYIPLILGFILGLQLVFEGIRWQMYPAYLLWLIALIVAFLRPKRRVHFFLRLLQTLGLTVLVVFSFALPSLLPVFDLPSPTGTYNVGTKDLLLTLDRAEPITPDTTDSRQLMIKTWYPATDISQGKADPYVDAAGRNGFAKKYGLPPFLLHYLDRINTHVYRNVPIVEKSFPVVVFSHGYHSKANGYYVLLSELASHGYVVLAINHTYESTGTTFPDGTEVYFNHTYAHAIESDSWSMVQPAIQAFKDSLSFEERHLIVQKSLRNYFVKDMVERWAQDISDVASQATLWNDTGFFQNDTGFFQNRLDTAKIGVLGHSRGGAAAGQALLTDKNIKAAVNLDGVQWGEMVDTAFSRPFLYLSSDWPATHENLNQHAYINKSKEVFYEGILANSGHSNFMDIPFLIPIASLSQAGTIDVNLAIEITRQTTLGFFDKYLKQQQGNSLKIDQYLPLQTFINGELKMLGR